MKQLKNWDNKTWLSSAKYISSFKNFLKSKTKITKKSKILDIGCGRANIISYLHKQYKFNDKPVGIDIVKNKSLKGFKPNKLDILAGSAGVVNSGRDIANTDYDKPKVQNEVSKLDNSPKAVLESERKGDEAINDPMGSGKTKSWSKGYSDYQTGGGKGSLSDFKNEANSWWNSAAGQKYAKDKNIKHRIASPSKQRYMGGVASSNRQSLKSYKQ